jgi:hypothetical protein
LNWLELVAEEDRQMSSPLWQEARIHHQPYRARFFLCARDSGRGNSGRCCPNGKYCTRWLRSVALYRRGLNTLGQSASACRGEPSSDSNSLRTQASYARASGALSFVNGARRIT